VVVDTGPEPITGSTRMKAGTATKLVLNAITTGAMVRIGKTYGNLMVDLRAASAKLVDRGERIVMEVAGGTREEAREAIAAAGGSVRTAIVMRRLGVARIEAERRLAGAGNRLREILGDPPPLVGDSG
jgi:N-acetylmuramic acid 6-phosphate etherase